MPLLLRCSARPGCARCCSRRPHARDGLDPRAVATPVRALSQPTDAATFETCPARANHGHRHAQPFARHARRASDRTGAQLCIDPAVGPGVRGWLGRAHVGIAGFFAVQGLWPVLPIAGLEIWLLWWAVQASLRSGERREVILVSDASVVVERRGPGESSRLVFPRHWATVKLRDPPVVLHPSRLVIESHGIACEVGRFLTEDERRSLAGRLRQLVGRTSESPALEHRSY